MSEETCPVCKREMEDMRHLGVECFYSVNEVVPQMEPKPVFVEVDESTAIWGMTRHYPAGTRDHYTTLPTGESRTLRVEIEQLPINSIRLRELPLFTMRCCKDCRSDFLTSLKEWADGVSQARMRRLVHEANMEVENNHSGAFVRDNGTIRELTEDECSKFEQERGFPPARVR